jgi:hypothetical protein
VNTATQTAQVAPDVAVAPGGSFVVVWMGTDGFEYGVRAQRYDAAGAPRGSNFTINAFTTGQQVTPSVAVDAAGNFVVAWNGYGTHGYHNDDGYGIFARRFDASGAPRGGGFLVNTNTTTAGFGPVVASDPAGNFVVAWMDYFRDGSRRGIVARRFDAQGAPMGAVFRVNTYTTESQSQPAVAILPGGDFVIAWEGYGGQDGRDSGIFAQRYDAAGAPQGGEFQLNTFTAYPQRTPEIAADSSGSFVVTWTSFHQDRSGYSIVGQRFDAAGARRGLEFLVNTYTTGRQQDPAITSDASGNFVVAWFSGQETGGGYGVFAQRFGGLVPEELAVDTVPGASDGNGVLEPGEAVDVRPSWRNATGAAQAFTGALGALSGPPGATYSTTDAGGDYGVVPDAATAPCADCYSVAVSDPGSRPATHWDASATESLAPDIQGQTRSWALHVGRSFSDVPATHLFYRFVETLLHHSITGGCGSGAYCPAQATTRAQMAVFALVAREGAGFSAPACGAPVFGDVPAGSPFCSWIEELARRGVVTGCGNGNYCPGEPVTRGQMAVFALATLDPAFVPPACAPPNTFPDVPEDSPFCSWVEELARRGVVSGCGGGNYCPGDAVTRDQMAVFISGTFGLRLYGP